MIRIQSMVAIAAIFLSLPLFAQNVGIGTTMPSEKLDVEGQIRMRTGAATGFVPVSDNIGVMTWTDPTLLLADEFWSTDGNTGTNPGVHFIGTLDNQDLIVRTNNAENIRVNTSGNIDVGATLDNARIYTHILSSDGVTQHGLYNYHDGTFPDTTYGIRSTNQSFTDSAKFGFLNHVGDEGIGARYGIFNQVFQNSGSSLNSAGVYTELTAYGTGDHYGSYTQMNLEGSSVSNQNYAAYKWINVGMPTYSGKVYGDFIHLDVTAGVRYGEYKELNSDSSYDGNSFGDYNRLYGTGDGINYGVYNVMEVSGTGDKYGLRNDFSNVEGAKYGVYNFFPNGTAAGIIVGTFNRIESDADAPKYGTYNHIAGGDNDLSGSYNYIEPAPTSAGIVYGVYSEVKSSGSGTHYGGYFDAGGSGNYGIYAVNTNIGGKAGFFNGDMQVQSAGRTHMLWSDHDENLVRVGTSSIGSDQHNGTTVAGVTVDYVIDLDRGAAEGTAIGIGSVEYMLDLTNQTAISNHFTPTVDNSFNLGTSLFRWANVYSANGTIVTSDGREKEDIQSMQYGLSEIMQLRPVSYKWKEERGAAHIREEDKELKLGLIAQDVLKVIPEVVQTHEWKALSEDQPDVFTQVPMERLGMSYHELVPVLIKAMQQQQMIIDKQNVRMADLEDRLDELHKLVVK